jgi:hypothetical protein
MLYKMKMDKLLLNGKKMFFNIFTIFYISRQDKLIILVSILLYVLSLILMYLYGQDLQWDRS